MMLRHFMFLGALSVAAVAGVVACGGSDSSTGSSAQAVTTNFDGVYVPQSAGAIGSIAFSNGRDYLLMPTGCKSQSCSEIGTYEIDDAKKVVVFTSSTGGSRSLSLKVISTEQREATIAKTQSVSGFALSVRDLIEKDASGTDLIGGDAGSLIALIQALINAITQAALGGQDMAQLGDSDAGSAVPTFAFDASAYLCPDASADAGTDAGACHFVDCTKNVPTAASSLYEIDNYFAFCPFGPLTYYAP